MIFDDLENYHLYEEEYDDTDFYFDDFDLSTLSPADRAELDTLFNQI